MYALIELSTNHKDVLEYSEPYSDVVDLTCHDSGIIITFYLSHLLHLYSSGKSHAKRAFTGVSHLALAQRYEDSIVFDTEGRHIRSSNKQSMYNLYLFHRQV